MVLRNPVYGALTWKRWSPTGVVEGEGASLFFWGGIILCSCSAYYFGYVMKHEKNKLLLDLMNHSVFLLKVR